MEVLLTREHGFCSGVRKAVELARQVAREARESGKTAWTLGPLIHNRHVVQALESAGVRTGETLEDIPSGDILILPSHGARPEFIAAAEERGITVEDATCSLVRKVQLAAKDLREAGYRLVVVGQPKHTEVKSVLGWAADQAVVVENGDQAEALADPGRTAVVAQTTQRPDKVREIVERLRSKGGEVHLESTLCPATSQRQEETRELAARVDVLIVVGGRESANTQRLAEIGREMGRRVYHIEAAQEVETSWLEGARQVGITAGTSTPDWTTKEVVARMKEIDADAQIKKAEGEVASPDAAGEPGEKAEMGQTGAAAEPGAVAEGDRVTGTVVKLSEADALVDIGYKTEGVLPLAEISRRSLGAPSEVLKEGQVIEVLVLKRDDDGRPLLSRKQIEEEEAWLNLEEAYEKGLTIEVPVTAQVKGGLVADVGTRGFIPASQVGLSFIKDLTPYVGKTLRVKVIELDREDRKVVLSEKKVLEGERETGRSQLLETLTEGETRTGEVRRVTDYGAFVDVGGVDGLLHVSEMSWKRVSDPREVVKEGDTVEVRILKIDRERGRVSLGLKQTAPDPWSSVPARYPVGAVVPGKVVSVTDFGVFVELEEGIEGLVHISQLSDKRVGHPSEVARVGDELKVKVLKVSPAERRISLSAREAEEELDRRQIKQFLKTGRDQSMTTIGDMVGDLLQGAGLGDGKDDKPGKK